MTIVFGTGHRPEDAGIDMWQMRELAFEALKTHPNEIEVVFCGMAAGWDLAFGAAAVNLLIPVWTVQPWAGHKPRKNDEDLYNFLLSQAKRNVVVVDQTIYPGPWSYLRRDEWMVDNADEGIAFWSGKQHGGTFNTIKYAEKVGKPVRNVYGGV